MPEFVLRIEPLAGEVFRYPLEKASLIIGRSSKADLVIPDRYLSRQQARVYKDGAGDWFVEDLGARNPTQLNGQALAGPSRLTLGDVLKVSETLIHVEGPDGPAPDSGRRETPSDSGVLYRPASAVMAQSQVLSVEPKGEADLRRQAARLRMLNEVHRILARSIELPELLELILERAFVELKPEEAVIFLKQPDGEFERAATRRAPGLSGDYLYSRSLVREVTEKQVAALVFDTSIDERFAASQSIMTSGVRSLLAAPLLDPDGCPGMIVLNTRAHVRRFTEEDMELLVSLASVAALRMRNIKLAEDAAQRRALEKELAIARQIQMGLLPKSLPDFPGWELYASSIPSRSVSGDLYQFQTRAEDKECIVFVADVAGKGISASLLTASLEALLTGPIEVGFPPEVICERLSRRLHARTSPERYATGFVAQLDADNGRLRYASAGHNPAILVHADGSTERLPSTGIPLGLLPVADYEGADLDLGPGDTLLIYTDGLSEAADPDEEEYGVDRLEEVCVANRGETVTGFAKALTSALDAFVKGEPYGDDRTFVIVRRNP